MARGPSKTKLARIAEQNRQREARQQAPEPKAAPVNAKPDHQVTSFSLPTRLLEDVQDTKVALQREMADKRVYTATNIVRASLQNFVKLEMDEQIALIRDYQKSTERVGE
jgi:hypothetical protein